MPKKLKCDSCSKGWCTVHVFQLNPANAYVYFRKKLKLRLCPKYSKNKAHFMKSMPLVNKDTKCYTPCFILEEEQNYYMENDERIRNNHKNKIQQEQNDDQTIVLLSLYHLPQQMYFFVIFSYSQLIAKHGRKRNYCSVCKNEYEDYLEHVDSDSHKRYLRSNKFTTYIHQIQSQIRDQLKKEQQPKEEIIEEEVKIEEIKMSDETLEIEAEKKMLLEKEEFF